MENKHGKSSLRNFIIKFNEELKDSSNNVTYNPKFKIYQGTPEKSKYIVVDTYKLKKGLNDTINDLASTMCGELEDMRKTTLKRGCVPSIENDFFIFKEDYMIWKMNWGIEEAKLACPKCGEKIKKHKRWKCGKCGATYKT